MYFHPPSLHPHLLIHGLPREVFVLKKIKKDCFSTYGNFRSNLNHFLLDRLDFSGFVRPTLYSIFLVFFIKLIK